MKEEGAYSVERKESHKTKLTELQIKEFLGIVETILRAKQPGAIFVAEEYISTDGKKTQKEIRTKMFADSISTHDYHKAFHEVLPERYRKTEISGKIIKGDLNDLKNIMKLIERSDSGEDIDDQISKLFKKDE